MELDRSKSDRIEVNRIEESYLLEPEHEARLLEGAGESPRVVGKVEGGIRDLLSSAACGRPGRGSAPIGYQTLR